MTGVAAFPVRDPVVIWQDVECGGYAADLELWETLAKEGSRVLDLGCGAGRVGLKLAHSGRRIIGLDLDPQLVGAFNLRAGALPASARVGNAADFAPDGELDLVIAPMQLMQLLMAAEERVGCLRCAAARLRPGGLFAAAVVERLPSSPGAEWSPPPADSSELDGWIYSSLPLETLVGGGRIVVRRLRQVISPTGELSEEVDETELRELTAAQLEIEGRAAGLHPAARLVVSATAVHVGSTVVVLEKGG